MKKYIDKNLNKILIYFILLCPLLDLLTGFLINSVGINFSFGIIGRSIFLFFLIIYSFFIKEGYKKKWYLFVILGLLLYFICFSFNLLIINNCSIGTLIKELVFLTRILYTPLSLLALLTLSKYIKIEAKHLVLILFTYASFIIFADITKTAMNSYDVAKMGHVGWFNSANEISAIFSILLPFAASYFLKTRKTFSSYATIITIFYALLLIGTKTPIISIFIIGISLIIYIFMKNKPSIKQISYSVLLVLLVGSIIPFTPFYNNLKIHYDYLKVDSMFEIFTDYEKFDHFVLGSRLKLLGNTNEVYKKAALNNKVFGLGTKDYKNNEYYKFVEMDIFDIYYFAGPFIFIFTFLIVPILYVLHLKNKPDKRKKLIYSLSIGLGLLISLIAGHVFSAPSVGLYFVIILIMFYNNVEGDII